MVEFRRKIVEIIGIDIGFGFTKATNGKESLVFKSVLGEATELQFREQIIAGDPSHVVDRLADLYEESGGFGVLNLMGYDWDDKDRWIHSMTLFAREVMPRLNRAASSVAV